MKKEYAFYKGDKLLGIGTKKELAEQFNLKIKTIGFYATPSHKKRSKSNNCKIVIRLEDDLDEEN